MVTIRRQGIGYRMRFVEAPPYGTTALSARDIPAVQSALGHYYGAGVHDGIICPLCAEARRVPKGRRTGR